MFHAKKERERQKFACFLFCFVFLAVKKVETSGEKKTADTSQRQQDREVN